MVNLNEIQRACSKDTEGPVMCVAGPGTGKTQLIGSRIEEMCKGDSGINPNMILAMTFTDAGAVAMRKRLFEFMGAEAYKVSVHTFHSLCNEIVQNNLDYFKVRNIEPVSDLESIEIMYQIIDELPAGHPLERVKGNSYFEAKRLKALFSIMKDEGWTADYVADQVRGYLEDIPTREDFIYKRKQGKFQAGDIKVALVEEQKKKMLVLTSASQLLDRYNEILKENERYDFSDMITWVLNAFDSDQDFLQIYQERYQYLLLDEFQDTNGVQAQLVDKLMSFWAPNPNIFAVMDEDQCLYEFNGARMRNITDFKHKYKPTVYVLGDNYRSVQVILDHSKNLIDFNQERLVGKFASLTKDLISHIAIPNMENPHAIEFSNPFQENAWIVDKVIRLRDEGTALEDIAILYRKHKQGEDVKKMLSARGIPVNIKRPINVLEQPIIQQVMLALDYVCDIAESARPISINDSKLFRIMHFTWMGIDRKDIEASVKLESFPDHIKEKLEIFHKLVDMYHNEPFVGLFEHLINSCGVLSHIMKSENHQQMIKELNALFVFVKSEFFKDPHLTGKGFMARVDKMKNENIPVSTLNINFQEEGVTMSTCHGAKGLEWEHVIIMGAIKGEWESSKGRSMTYTLPDTLTFSSTENKLESARRLFYVAMTRAKHSLHVTYHLKSESGSELEPSRFIDEAGLSTHLQKREIDPGIHFPYLVAPEKFLPGLETEQLNRYFENYRISISHVNKYKTCPIAFYYENVLRVPFSANENLIYGNSVHIALKFLFDRARDGMVPLQSFLAAFKSELDRNAGQISKAAYERRLAEGYSSLTYYHKEIFPKENKITINEYEITNIEIEGVPFKYILDKGEFNKHNIVIADYKTGKTNYFLKNAKPADEKQEGGGYWRQMVAGKLVVDRITWKPWSYAGAYLLLFDDGMVTRHDVEVDKEAEKIVIAQIQDAYKNILAHNFEVGCGEEKCDWCNFVKHL